jgi:CRP/FNR family transcriptional regulator, cyclic AMP receptor protein
MSCFLNDALKTHPLTCLLTEGERAHMAAMGQMRRYPAGSLIFDRGDPGDCMFLLQTGRVRIVLTTVDGKTLVVSRMLPGAIFGEMSVLDGKPRSAAAEAEQDSVVAIFPKSAFIPFLRTNHALMENVLALVTERLRATNDLVEMVALLPLPQRLARLLLRFASEHGQAHPDGIYLSEQISQTLCGQFIAASREAVNRQLKKWEEEGILSLEDNHMILRNKAALINLLDPVSCVTARDL